MQLGLYDLLVVAVAVMSYLLGRHRGFAWQVSGLLTLVGGGLCATVLSRPLGPVFAEGIVGRFVAWVVVYALVAVCLYVLTLRFQHRIRELEFEELDKRFGGALGAFKGLAVFALITLVAVAVSVKVEQAVKASLAGRALRRVVHELRPLVPERVHDAFGPWLDAVDPSPDPAPSSPPASSPTPTPAPPASPASPPERPPAPVATPLPGPSPTPTARPRRPPELTGPPLPPPSPPPRDEPDVEPRYLDEDPWDTSEDPPDPLAPR